MSEPEPTIYRAEVPVDDQWHALVTGPIMAWGCRRPGLVEEVERG